MILVIKSKMLAEGSLTLLECVARRYALNTTKQYGLHIHALKGDNINAIDDIKDEIIPKVYGDVVITEITRTTMEVGCGTFMHITRKVNQAAHAIACGPNFISIRHAPSHVFSILKAAMYDD